MSAAAGEPAAFPWEEVMRAGFGLLRLSPAAFWSMTPREIACAIGVVAPGHAPSPTRRELADLMLAFPDTN